MGRTASIVLPAAGSNILERMKGRHISSKLLAKPGNRLIEGDFYDDQHLFVSVLDVEQLDLKGVWKQRKLAWTAKEIIVGSSRDNGVTKLIETIPLHEVTTIESKNETGIARDFLKYLHMGRGGNSTKDMNLNPAKELLPAGGSSFQSQRKTTDKRINEITAAQPPGHGPDGPSQTTRANTISATLSHENIDMERAMILKTMPDGFNCGRSYVFRVDSDEETDSFLTQIRVAVDQAIRNERKKSKFQESQMYCQDIWGSSRFQMVIALFIAANFIVNCATAQILPVDGSETADAFEIVEIIFTVIFTVELVLNAYAHWFWPFIKDGWNILDIIVIVISIIALSVSHLAGFSVLRLTRAFRILRLFGRLKALKKIITGLIMSIMPVLNAFMITIVVTMIYGIVGVTIFRDEVRCTQRLFSYSLYR